MHTADITQLAEAEQFLYNYGFDMQNLADQQELAQVKAEAVSFIERRFLDSTMDWEQLGEISLNLQVPAFFHDTTCDARHLLMMAATGDGMNQRWACALLKVMHTICHINNTILYRYYRHAKKQILPRYYQAIHQQEDGTLLFGNPEVFAISIAGFEVKDEKSRDSMLIKLLRKRENVAEEIFDMIGVRIITHTPADAILALEVLRRNKMMIPPNLMPSRSRNSLLDVDAFKVLYQEAIEGYQWGQVSFDETMQLIHTLPIEPPAELFNPKNTSSLGTYRSIHLTERQLIRFSTELGSEMRFFFPYEIQITDQDNHLQSLSGNSAHALYKQKQLLQARRRVLGPLFIANAKSNESNFLKK